MEDPRDPETSSGRLRRFGDDPKWITAKHQQHAPSLVLRTISPAEGEIIPSPPAGEGRVRGLRCPVCVLIDVHDKLFKTVTSQKRGTNYPHTVCFEI